MREWRNGRRARLRIWCLMACGFESHLPYQSGFKSQVPYQYLVPQFSWLKCRPVTPESAGSSPAGIANYSLDIEKQPSWLEHCSDKAEVVSSILTFSTNSFNLRAKIRFDLIVNRTIPSDLGDIGIQVRENQFGVC